MSVIIRLQGLPWSASALDIRQFFKGLTIPAGGVHIIGGERGDAFIAFSSDEDARQAMMRNMAAINGTVVKLYLSSKSEMQSVIEEARTSETAAAGGGGSASTQMQQQQQQQQPPMQQGMGQGFQGQQMFPGNQGMGNQRFPPQFDVGQGMNQGQFPGAQNFMGSGQNQMQSQMQGQQMGGQQNQNRNNQFGGQSDRNQGAMMQQNFQGNQQFPGQAGMNNQQGLPTDNRGQQSQTAAGNLGYGMDTNSGSDNFNQWQNMGQVQGQGGQNQNFGMNQQFYGGDDSSQGQFPGQQYGQRMGGRDGQFPPQQQQLPGQGGDFSQKPENFGFSQQGGFGQEGIQQGFDNSGRFPMRGERPGMQQRGGLLPHPAMPGQNDEQGMGKQSDSQGQVPSRPGPGSRGTPDDAARGLESQPLMDQWPGATRNRDQMRPGGYAEEQYPSQGLESREGFPSRRGDQGAMQQQRDIQGGFRGRGMLPTPDMPLHNRPPVQGTEPFSDMGAMEQGQWPGYSGDEPMNREGAHSDKGMDPSRDMRNDPDFRRNQGHFGPGADSDFRGGSQGSSGGRSYDGTRGRYEGGGTSGMVLGGTDGTQTGGPVGMQTGGGLSGMKLGGAPGGMHTEGGSEGRPWKRGPDGTPLLRDPDVRPFERGPDGRPFERGPEGRPFERGTDGRLFDQNQDRRSLERGPDGRPMDRGPDGRPMDRGPDGRPVDRGPDGRPVDRGPDGRPVDRGPDGRPVDRGPDGRLFERGQDRRSLERGPDGRPVERGPDGRSFQGLEGRPFDRRGGRFDAEGGYEPSPRFDGPPDQRFSQHENYDPMDMECDPQGYEDPAIRDSHDQGFPGPRDFEFETSNRPFGGRESRDGRNDGYRGRGGFDRGRGPGFGRDFPPHGHPGEEGYPDYSMEDGFDDRRFKDLPPGEGMYNFGEDFKNDFPGNRELDFDSRRDAGRGRGETEQNRGGRMDHGRMDGPRGRMDRGRGRFDVGPGRDMDRRQGGPSQDDFDSRSRDKSWGENKDEIRSSGKPGLLGDAPVGLLPAPPSRKEEDKPMQQRDSDTMRDRDRRGNSDRRDREDRGRDDRYNRRSDRRRSRDKSADRDRHSRRSDRDRDRNDRRDHDRSRDRSSDRSKDKDRDRSSVNKDRDSRSKETSSKDASNGKKENEKEATKSDKKPDNQKTPSTDSAELQQNKYMQAKGFPASYNYREIRRFFFGCELPFDGIKIINNIKGQRTGTAYLKFVNEEAAKRALKKNGETIFGNPVALTFTTSKAFESEVDSQAPPNSTDSEKAPSGPPPVVKKDQEKGGLIVMIQGLPFNIKREDIVNFFSSVKIGDNGDAVFLEYDSRNQSTGVAYLEVASVQDFKTAMGHDGRMFGNRNLKISAGRREDMELCMKKQQEMFQRQANKMGEQSVLQPNLGPGVMGARPPLMGQAPGRPGPQPLMGLMGPINMPIIPPRNGPAFDPNLTLQRQQQQPQQQQGDKPAMDQGPSHCVHIQGLPMLATYKDIREFFGELNIVAHRGVQIVHDGVGKPMGEGFVEFATKDDKEKALKKDKTSMGRHILAVKSVAKADMIERLRNARFVGLGPGQGPPNQPNFPPGPGGPPMAEPKPIPPGVLNRKWCYLSCQNFPPAVSITEIMAFFQGYSPIPESIRLHYAADGSPTGNAVVGFTGMEDANRALQELNGKMCRRSAVALMPAV